MVFLRKVLFLEFNKEFVWLFSINFEDSNEGLQVSGTPWEYFQQQFWLEFLREAFFSFQLLSLFLHSQNLVQSFDMDPTVSINVVPTYNQTQEWLILEDFVKNLVEDWRYQARVGNVIYTLLVLLYLAMILVGATGNILVILVSGGLLTQLKIVCVICYLEIWVQ